MSRCSSQQARRTLVHFRAEALRAREKAASLPAGCTEWARQMVHAQSFERRVAIALRACGGLAAAW